MSKNLVKDSIYTTFTNQLGCSVLPLRVSKNGLKEESLEEVISCERISGSANYKDNMPRELILIRRLKDGTEYKATYVQKG